MAQMVRIISTTPLLTTCLESVSISLIKEVDQNASREIGLPSTGLVHLRMVERSLTRIKSQEVDQKLLHSVLEKSSIAGILLSLNYIKVIRLILTAHLIMLMVVLSPGLQLVVSLSHFIPMLTSTSKLLSAIEFQNSLNIKSNQ